MDSRNDVESGESRLPHGGSASELSETHWPIQSERLDDHQPQSRSGDAANRRQIRQALTAVLPQRRKLAVQVISYAGLLYAAFGFYNQYYLQWIDSPWFSMYSDRIAVLVFGVVRVIFERDAYTRRRLMFL
jgi:hypothetical protein